MAHFKTGHTQSYGRPFAEEARKLWQSADAVRTGAPVACDLQAATAHVCAVNGMHESMPTIQRFPAALIQQQAELTWVRGLQEALITCYETNCLPAETGQLAWARPGRIIDLTTYTTFPQDASLEG